MTQKRFGPTNDAGTVIKEKEGQRTIEASAFGWAGYAGPLERGAVGELIVAVGKNDMVSKTGSYIPESFVPDCGIDFWDHGNGAGGLLMVRLTDGLEVKASLTLFDRKVLAGVFRNPVIRVDAHNGGGWGGRRDQNVCDLDAVPGDIQSEVTVKLPDAFVVKANKYARGYIKFTETGTSYQIVSHTAGDGVAGAVVTVSADAKMLTDFASGTDKEIIITKDQTDAYGRERKLAVVIKDGEVSPATTWGMDVYVNDGLAKSWPNLSSDPNSDAYFVPIINEDESNDLITVTDLWVGAVTADTRPANDCGVIPAAGIVAKSLTVAGVIVDDSAAGANTIAAFTFGADVVPDTYTLTRGAADWTVTSLKQGTHTFPDASDGVAYVAENSLGIGFTITESAAVATQVFVITVVTLDPSEAIGGQVFPDIDNSPNISHRIVTNTALAVAIQSGDMTVVGAAGDRYRLEYKQELTGGYDGLAALNDQAYLDAFDISTSPFNQTLRQGYGIIKFATPGVYRMSGINAAAVQQAGVTYCEEKNHFFRYEVDETITDEATARDAVNDTLGRSDHAKVCFPSYVYVADPLKPNMLKLVPMIGMAHGREAKMAKVYSGYHKVCAGIDVTFPRIRKLPTGKKILNGELLNKAGIQRIDKRGGKYVLWGARIPSVDPAFRFSNHREQLSFYEAVLFESFDYVIFAINDEEEQPGLISALTSFFFPEWVNRAIRGDSFEDAAIIKIDDENNTDATRLAGDQHAEVSLQQADTIERFIITIGPKGVFESVAA